jgi:hypothetical protein
MRRLIKEAAKGTRNYGNVSTLEDPAVIEEVEKALAKAGFKPSSG